MKQRALKAMEHAEMVEAKMHEHVDLTETTEIEDSSH